MSAHACAPCGHSRKHHARGHCQCCPCRAYIDQDAVFRAEERVWQEQHRRELDAERDRLLAEMHRLERAGGER